MANVINVGSSAGSKSALFAISSHLTCHVGKNKGKRVGRLDLV